MATQDDLTKIKERLDDLLLASLHTEGCLQMVYGILLDNKISSPELTASMQELRQTLAPLKSIHEDEIKQA